MAVEETYEPPSVAVVEGGLRDLLDECDNLGTSGTIDRPLGTDQIGKRIDEEVAKFEGSVPSGRLPIIFETAARKVFVDVLKTTTVDQPGAQRIWGFLDILLLICELRQTGRSIIWYLVEELVESQTADQCRLIFDYLDVRRERLTQREFQVTHLIILRTCNELLRRLSRAEDATFCGRVFFFLFQVFPLGEQSSVNLRGEFHTDNVTLFEDGQPANTPTSPEDTMETDEKSEDQMEEGPENERQRKVPSSSTKKASKQADAIAKFYPIFWRLQRDFSMPLRIIESEEFFNNFKSGLEETIEKFGATSVVKTKSVADESHGTKRKRGQDGHATGHTANQDNYNPKYLTSRDLFELELSDLSFQRHILVQALILLDFLLSLSDQAQKKIDSSGITRANSSVNYSLRLPEEKKTWALGTRAKIASYLQSGPDGSLYYRMVSTVLARDKNWIWWKIQKCPPIAGTAVTAAEHAEAARGVREATAPRRLRARPVGAMDLTFLTEADGGDGGGGGGGGGLESLRGRCVVPPVTDLAEQAKGVELDLDFADGEEKETLLARLEGLDWRAVRAATRTRFARLDKLEPGKKVFDVLDERPLSGTTTAAGDGDGVTGVGDRGKGPPGVSDENGIVAQAAGAGAASVEVAAP